MSYHLIVLLLLSSISRFACYNILFVSIGQAGHVIPIFELAKGLKDHNVTFLTQQIARSYADFDSYPNSSSFRLIYTTDTPEALEREKQKERDLVTHAANHSFFDGMSYTMQLLSDDSTRILIKTIELMMNEKFDLLIGNSVMKSLYVLAKEAKIPCVVQSTEVLPSMLDFNLPNIFVGFTRAQMTQLKYRLYNVIFKIRLIIGVSIRMIPSLQAMSKTLPRVPGPFENSFTMKSLFSNDAKCLELFSVPPTFYTPSYPNLHTKYLGAFIDRTAIGRPKDNDLTQWIESKVNSSIIYGAFGTSSLIYHQRMKNLIDGLVDFLIEKPESNLLLVFRGSNFDVYQNLFDSLIDENHRAVLTNRQRVRIENRFVPQKWILQQPSIKFFLSHCGMGSCSEAMFFGKVILCMPFNMDQFMNGMTIEQSSLGLSLFTPPSLWESLIRPHNFQGYVFSPSSVTQKLTELWTNDLYQRNAQLMSLEAKHAGGTQRALEEIEFFMQLNGNLDRFAPFQSTLPFYQRYLLDIFCVFVVLPSLVMIYFLRKCSRKSPKVKHE